MRSLLLVLIFAAACAPSDDDDSAAVVGGGTVTPRAPVGSRSRGRRRRRGGQEIGTSALRGCAARYTGPARSPPRTVTAGRGAAGAACDGAREPAQGPAAGVWDAEVAEVGAVTERSVAVRVAVVRAH